MITYRRRDNLKDTLAEELIGEAISDGFETLGDSLVSSLKAEWPEDTGKSRRSIKKRISGAGFKTRMLVFASAKNAEFVEKGRDPGKAPPLRPAGGVITRGKNKGKPRMESILSPWLKRRGFSGPVSLRRFVAYKIGQRIAREGIKGKFLFRDLREKHASEISKAYSSIQTRIAELLND